MVSVRKSGKHVTNSPFKILVGPSEIGDASKVRVWGKGLSEGHTFQVAEFIVDTRNAGASPERPLLSTGASNEDLSFFPARNPLHYTLLPELPAPSLLGFTFWSHLGESECLHVSSLTFKRRLSCPEFVSPTLTGSQEAYFKEFSRPPIPCPLGQCLTRPSFPLSIFP